MEEDKKLFDALEKLATWYSECGEAETRIKEVEMRIQSCRTGRDCWSCKHCKGDDCTLHEDLIALTIPYNNARKSHREAEFEAMNAYWDYKLNKAEQKRQESNGEAERQDRSNERAVE